MPCSAQPPSWSCSCSIGVRGEAAAAVDRRAVLRGAQQIEQRDAEQLRLQDPTARYRPPRWPSRRCPAGRDCGWRAPSRHARRGCRARCVPPRSSPAATRSVCPWRHRRRNSRALPAARGHFHQDHRGLVPLQRAVGFRRLGRTRCNRRPRSSRSSGRWRVESVMTRPADQLLCGMKLSTCPSSRRGTCSCVPDRGECLGRNASPPRT